MKRMKIETKIDQQVVTRDCLLDGQGELIYEEYEDFINRVTSEIEFYKPENFIDVKYPDKNIAIIVFKEVTEYDIDRNNV